MKTIFRMKSAFSLVELIFVIVVLGIVASISADTIAQVFKNTVSQKATNIAAIKVELAVQQIANRLKYAVPWSLLVRNVDGTGTPEQLGDVGVNDTNDKVLEWVGTDGDSFEATGVPGWSGYCDINDPAASATICPTPGSALDNTNTVITKLGGAGLADAIVLFDTPVCKDGPTVYYSATTLGFTGNSSCAFSLAGSTGVNLIMPAGAKNIADKYDVAWSAYALVPRNAQDLDGDGRMDIFDLELRYNYQPWNGDSYINASSQVIARNVLVFKVAQNSLSKNDIRIKICVTQQIGATSTDFVSMCKEKVVMQ